MLQNHINASINTTSVEQNFRDVLGQICLTLKRFGLDVVPYNNPDLKDFSRMSPFSKATSLADARTYLEVIQSDVEQLKNERFSEGQSLWLALKYFGLRPTSDLFETLGEENAIELYNLEGIQLWRNFRFMNVCSYTLEEIFCYTWQERYERDEKASALVAEALSTLVTDNPRTIKCAIRNVLKEKFSEKKLTIDVLHEHLSPVFGPGNQIGGFVVASKVKVVEN